MNDPLTPPTAILETSEPNIGIPMDAPASPEQPFRFDDPNSWPDGKVPDVEFDVDAFKEEFGADVKPVGFIGIKGTDTPAEPPKIDGDLPTMETDNETLDALAPRVERVERKLSDGHREQVYIQRRLSWLGKLDLYALLSRALKALTGDAENPLDLGELLTLGTALGRSRALLEANVLDADEQAEMQVQQLEAVGKIIPLIAHIAEVAPGLFRELYCVVLSIPRDDRKFAYAALEQMDDEMGEDILLVAIDQNWEHVESFFVERAPRILRRVMQRREEVARQSKS